MFSQAENIDSLGHTGFGPDSGTGSGPGVIDSHRVTGRLTPPCTPGRRDRRVVGVNVTALGLGRDHYLLVDVRFQIVGAGRTADHGAARHLQLVVSQVGVNSGALLNREQPLFRLRQVHIQ